MLFTPNHQGRINHFIVPVVSWEAPAARAPRSTAKFLPHAVWMFKNDKFRVGLNVTTKKVVNYLGEEKCTLRENPVYACEKRAPTLRWYSPPQMVNTALPTIVSL